MNFDIKDQEERKRGFAHLSLIWGAVVDKSKKHSINACKNFEIN